MGVLVNKTVNGITDDLVYDQPFVNDNTNLLTSIAV